jgi:hypothetical protein
MVDISSAYRAGDVDAAHPTLAVRRTCPGSAPVDLDTNHSIGPLSLLAPMARRTASVKVAQGTVAGCGDSVEQTDPARADQEPNHDESDTGADSPKHQGDDA